MNEGERFAEAMSDILNTLMPEGGKERLEKLARLLDGVEVDENGVIEFKKAPRGLGPRRPT